MYEQIRVLRNRHKKGLTEFTLLDAVIMDKNRIKKNNFTEGLFSPKTEL